MILAEIAKPGSRRISLEGLGLLSVIYYMGNETLSDIAQKEKPLQSKLGLSASELFHLLSAILDEIRWKRALS
ncbi:MAG: hypothetical protein OMM_12781 [Candidatus Magnetoglobus multicellularis str. Araruama]|uniref:Uncharacterized protein n=1 Tax=Candidatus Magnetoglobus multicellularis str. Araruama TaxID=890399 RepID=A0A1V1NV62_9BACT|nr:MAG: hypothetical protein OMM_12781 [Candidatus Magnetoglobus multicellularis str. Araruama]